MLHRLCFIGFDRTSAVLYKNVTGAAGVPRQGLSSTPPLRGGRWDVIGFPALASTTVATDALFRRSG